jgi:outer membrane receptor protein involved in Fe transport
VEVIKGPASALYPNNAFGGIVNVVSRDAPLTPETRVSIEAGDFSRLRAGLSTGARVDNLGYFFDVNTRNLSGLRDESVNDRDQVSAKLAYQLNDATRVSTRIEYLDEYKIERADLTKEALETDPTQAGRLSSSTDLTQSSLSLNLEHLLESGQFDFALVRREKETVGESRFRGPQDENDLGYSSKSMYRHDFNQSNIIVGYNGYHGEKHTDQYERGDTDLSGSFRHSIYNLNINAYFAQYRLNASDDMILTGGLRYEKIHLASIHFTSNHDAQSADFSELALKLGLTYQLNSDHML